MIFSSAFLGLPQASAPLLDNVGRGAQPLSSPSYTCWRCSAMCATEDGQRGPWSSRRDVLTASGAAIAGLAAASGAAYADTADVVRSKRPLVYRVDFTDPPTTHPFPKSQEGRVIKDLCAANVVFVGEHHDSAADQALELDIITRMLSNKKAVAIGLEQVQQRYQPVLDNYLTSSPSTTTAKAADSALPTPEEEALQRDLDWDGYWPFQAFLPLLRLAKARKIPLVALSADDESIGHVQGGGLEGLSTDERNRYVVDFKGFIQFVRDPGFKVYSEKVVLPTYDTLVAADPENASASRPRISKQNFFAARILADEAVASKAATFVSENPATTLICLQSVDRVKYGYGATARAERIAKTFGGTILTKTLLLNPTAPESLSLSPSLRLALAYDEDLYATRLLADYMWFSRSPPPALIPRMMAPDSTNPLEYVRLF